MDPAICYLFLRLCIACVCEIPVNDSLDLLFASLNVYILLTLTNFAYWSVDFRINFHDNFKVMFTYFVPSTNIIFLSQRHLGMKNSWRFLTIEIFKSLRIKNKERNIRIKTRFTFPNVKNSTLHGDFTTVILFTHNVIKNSSIGREPRANNEQWKLKEIKRKPLTGVGAGRTWKFVCWFPQRPGGLSPLPWLGWCLRWLRRMDMGRNESNLSIALRWAISVAYHPSPLMRARARERSII